MHTELIPNNLILVIPLMIIILKFLTLYYIFFILNK